MSRSRNNSAEPDATLFGRSFETKANVTIEDVHSGVVQRLRQ